jgi:hypothetical protein
MEYTNIHDWVGGQNGDSNLNQLVAVKHVKSDCKLMDGLWVPVVFACAALAKGNRGGGIHLASSGGLWTVYCKHSGRTHTLPFCHAACQSGHCVHVTYDVCCC